MKDITKIIIGVFIALALCCICYFLIQFLISIGLLGWILGTVDISTPSPLIIPGSTTPQATPFYLAPTAIP